MIISIDLEMHWQSPAPFHDKNTSNLGIHRSFFNLIEDIYGEASTNITPSGGRLNAFQPGLVARPGFPHLSLLFKLELKVLSRAIKQEKDIKVTQIGKEEVKLFVFTDAMILYIEKSWGLQ